MRLFPILMIAGAAVLAGCIAEEDKNDVTNEQGDKVNDPTVALNGFWDGQFDQAGDLRVLVYNGNVYALDETNGYYGTVLLNDDTSRATFALTAYTLTEADTTGNQYVADGPSEDYNLSGLLFSSTADNDTLVGDYENDTLTGSFLLEDDGTWSNNSDLDNLAGKWTATGYEFYVQPLTGKASYKGISTDGSGCTFEGEITLLDETEALYAVSLIERKNCAGFNETDASGYAAVNADGNLEVYLRKNNDLLFMIFTAPVSDTTTDDTTTDDTTDDTTTDDTAV